MACSVQWLFGAGVRRVVHPHSKHLYPMRERGTFRFGGLKAYGSRRESVPETRAHDSVLFSSPHPQLQNKATFTA